MQITLTTLITLNTLITLITLTKNHVTTQHLILLLWCSCGFAIRTHRI